MGTKRAFREDVHPSRHQNIKAPVKKQSKRARMTDSGESQEHTESVNSLKGKIRDLVRLLKRDILPADVRVEKERALDGYKADLQRLEEEKEKKTMIGKYRMVRFFERQKAQRALKKLKNQASLLSPSSAERPSLADAIHEATVDLNYTLYFPLYEKYQSLYPRTAEQGPESEKEIGGRGERKLGGQRPPLWGVVEEAMADGTLDELRDGRLRKTMVIGRSKPETKKKPDEVKTVKRATDDSQRAKTNEEPASDGEHVEPDGSSDGGFFEE